MASKEELAADGDAAELDVQQISDGVGSEDNAAEQASVRLPLHAAPKLVQNPEKLYSLLNSKNFTSIFGLTQGHLVSKQILPAHFKRILQRS